MENKGHAAIPPQYDSYALRDRVVNQSFVAISILATIAVAVAGVRTLQYGASGNYLITLAAATIFVTVSAFRKRLSVSAKVGFLVAVVLTVVLAGLRSYGFLASAKMYIALVPIYISFLVPYRHALASLVVFLAIYLVMGYLYSTGQLTYLVDIEQYVNSTIAWYVEGSIILLTSWGLLHLGYNYRKFLDSNNRTIKAQYKQLTEKDSRYKILFETSNDAIILVKGPKFYDWNSKTCELFQCDEAYLRSIDPPALSPEYQPDGERSVDKVMRYFQKLNEEGPQVFDWQHVRPNGELFFVSVSLNLIDIGGETYVHTVLRDISEKKANESELERYRNELEKLVRERTNELDATVLELQRSNKELKEKGEIIHAQNMELKTALDSLKSAQAQLLQAEKMASLGVLTAGVAHEINNPLNYIQGGYSGLTKYFRDQGIEDPDIIDLLQNIRTGIDRSVSIVSGLNQFSRNNELYDEDCSIHKILDNCLLMLNGHLRQGVQIIKDYRDEELIVPGNVGKIHQVFINLLTNASHAVSADGSIKITTDKIDCCTVIRVEDDGTGISEENLSKITDPFFTTKEPGEGTGLGLSISYSIIQEHKGTIDFKSELGQGTEVIVTLPLKK